MAGGTGGHIFPALAVADYLREKGTNIVWLGTRKGLEAKIIPENGIQIEYLSIAGLRGKGVMRLLMTPFKLIHATIQAIKILKKHNPTLVLGMGGYVTGPGGIAAKLLGKKLVIHEQNAVAGMTNKFLAKIATKVFEAFPNSFTNSSATDTKITCCGNPLRKEFTKRPKKAKHPLNNKVNLLVVGGSLGAKILNEVVPATISSIPEHKNLNIIHQAGERTIDIAKTCYQKNHVEAKIIPFIDDVAKAYIEADIVICRAGALTISEIAMIGVPSILIPLPHAVDDHQTKNAMYLADNGAAILMPQHSFTKENLAVEIIKLINSNEKRKQMSKIARGLAKKEATAIVAEYCLEAA